MGSQLDPILEFSRSSHQVFNVFLKMFPTRTHFIPYVLPKVDLLINTNYKEAPKGYTSEVLLQFCGVPDVSKKHCDGLYY